MRDILYHTKIVPATLKIERKPKCGPSGAGKPVHKQELLLKPEHEELKEIIEKAIGPKMNNLTPEEADILIKKGLGE